jgi:hypothetical protein
MSQTDLYGNPLSPKPEFHLNKWQKRQAALLYHFASMDYLKGLKALLDDFVKGVDITLDTAKQEGRDKYLMSERWGMRETSANFSTYGFPGLQDFQKATNRDIALRATESYEFTGYNQCSRLLGELSLQWTTQEENEQFDAGMEKIGRYATPIDGVMRHRWDERTFSIVWGEHHHLFPRIPKFRVRTDVEAESGKRPVRTGVYVSQDDSLGALQFAWTGNSDGCLADCQTFNDLGLQAFRIVGRDGLWSDDPRLLPIVKQPQYIAGFKELDWFHEPDYLNDSSKPKEFIGMSGFTTRPCKWYYVELVEGEFDDEEDTEERLPVAQRQRCEAGLPCPREGYWFTPAQSGSRRTFKTGEVMPEVGGDYGATIWQWDQNQDPPKL